MAHIRTRKTKEGETRYHVVWKDPQGVEHSKGCGSSRHVAEKVRKRLEAELVLGQYDDRTTHTWDEFYAEYDRTVIEGHDTGNAIEAIISLRHFVRICQPTSMRSIDRLTLDRFVRARSAERGLQRGSTISMHTLNKELRYVRAALGTAHKWGYLSAVPDIPFQRAPAKAETFISPDEFSCLYGAVGAATAPVLKNAETADWWRAFLLFQYMTGWRVSQVLAIQWVNVDLDNRVVLSPAKDNKGRRDTTVALHEVLADHLRPLAGTFDEHVFPFAQSKATMYNQFHLIQKQAGVTPKNKPAGQLYGFHDLRRGFATANAERVDLFELQRLMQHKSLTTTRLYVAMAHRAHQTASNVLVPEGVAKHG